MIKPVYRSENGPCWIVSVLVPLSFFLIEMFAFRYLQPMDWAFASDQLWPLAFGGLWSVMLGFGLRIFHWKAACVLYGISYFASLLYAVVQTGYYYLFQEMMWFSDFLYASEGTDYLDVLLGYPADWFVWILGLLLLGVGCICKFPRWRWDIRIGIGALLICVLCAVSVYRLPSRVFEKDATIQHSGSDYGRSKSLQAAYEQMHNTHRLYEICGLYQTAAKDFYAHLVYPLTPEYVTAQNQARRQINGYFASDLDSAGTNAMSGILADKNIVLVLMESVDDWMIGSFTPTLTRLTEEGIHFTNFYTPPYGGVRTFNTEFCINTGSFLSSQGGYAFDYITNQFSQSLANQLRRQGYSAKLFHYNDPSFYSRDVFSKALGYEEYVCYSDYLMGTDDEKAKNLLYDDCLLFNNDGLNAEFFREGKKLNFVITRSAHLSYKYNEVLSHWGLKKYPGFRGLTWNEETDCALLKARLVDDFFTRLLEELESHGLLENTVIIGVTDHYTYGYKDTENLLMLSGVEYPLLLEKTPCFIWYDGCESMQVEKLLNTSDFLPTVLNMLGIQTEQDYIGHDAFDPAYQGYVPFSDGSWITERFAYDANSEQVLELKKGTPPVKPEYQIQMAEKVRQFVQINNLILETDYYRK